MVNLQWSMNYTDNIRSLWTETKNYLELQKEYLKLDTAEKLSVLLSAVATVVLCATFALAAILFVMVALTLLLAKVVGGVWSSVIMGGVMLFIIVIILIARKRWIVQPISRFIARLIVGEDKEEDEP